MKIGLFLVFFHLNAVVLSSDLMAIEETSLILKESVLTLGDQNITEAIANFDNLLVEFYSPRCGHCQHFASDYEKIAKMLQEEGSTIKLAKVDDTTEKNTSIKYKIIEYPTIKLFHRGKISDYKGLKKTEDIINWLKYKTEPSISEAIAYSDLSLELETHNNLVLLVGIKDLEVLETIKALSKIYAGDVRFLYTTSKDLIKELNVDHETQALMFRSLSGEKLSLNTTLNTTNLKSFIDQNIYSSVTVLNNVLIKNMLEEDKTIMVLFAQKDNNDEGALASLKTAISNFSKPLVASVCYLEQDKENLCNLLFNEIGLFKSEIPSVKVFIIFFKT